MKHRVYFRIKTEDEIFSYSNCSTSRLQGSRMRGQHYFQIRDFQAELLRKNYFFAVSHHLLRNLQDDYEVWDRHVWE
jgi:hypothetical protein